MENKPLHTLVSAFACGPHWGSEIGMGWNWVISTSNFCQLTVITELGFKKDIEAVLPDLEIKLPPKFYYIDIGARGRKLFWKQGAPSFYSHYKRWQKKAYMLAKELMEQEDFDIIHQLNMIGYREPGYLWKIQGKPYIIGPIGGYNQFPQSYFSILNTKDKLFYLARNIINKFQMHFLTRPHKAYKKANVVILATPSGQKIVSKYTKKEPIILPETGAHKLPMSLKTYRDNEKLVLVWVGLIAGRKALPIALNAIAQSKHRDKVILNIIGEGPNTEQSKAHIERLGLDNVNWFGVRAHEETKREISKADMLFFTSLLDATSTVIFEALQANTPVMCHDTCGFGAVIDATCGIKIPLINVSKSIELFSQAIDNLVENPSKIEQLEKGCRPKVEAYYWNEKGKKLYNIYKECLVK